jgi:outer membrane protein TolC
MLSVIDEQAAQARAEIVAAEGAYRGGRGSQAEVIAAHGTLAALEDRASEFRRRVLTAKTSLARWIGQGAEAPLAAPPPMEGVPLDPAMLERDLSHHPEIQVLAKQEEVASAEARLAQASRTPDWSIEVAYQQRGPSFPNMVSVGVSVPLPWDRGNRQDRETAAKLALAEQARAQREETLRAHIAEVRVMIAEWQNGRERLARYGRDLVPLARERARAALAAYQGGRTSLAELLAARRNETEVRTQAVQLEMETARVWAQLSFLVPHAGGVQ